MEGESAWMTVRFAPIAQRMMEISPLPDGYLPYSLRTLYSRTIHTNPELSIPYGHPTINNLLALPGG